VAPWLRQCWRGASISHGSKVRAGLLVPHKRHRESLREAVNVNGTFFSVTPSGSESMIHQFSGKQGHDFIGSLIEGPSAGHRGTLLYGGG